MLCICSRVATTCLNHKRAWLARKWAANTSKQALKSPNDLNDTTQHKTHQIQPKNKNNKWFNLICWNINRLSGFLQLMKYQKENAIPNRVLFAYLLSLPLKIKCEQIVKMSKYILKMSRLCALSQHSHIQHPSKNAHVETAINYYVCIRLRHRRRQTCTMPRCAHYKGEKLCLLLFKLLHSFIHPSSANWKSTNFHSQRQCSNDTTIRLFGCFWR